MIRANNCKTGDVVVCIVNKTLNTIDLKMGDKYVIVSVLDSHSGVFLSVKNDEQETSFIRANNFVFELEYRKMKINKIKNG